MTSKDIRGVDLIAQERRRQIQIGYSRDEDIGREDELTHAGAAYALAAGSTILMSEESNPNDYQQPVPGMWPWGDDEWDPTGDPKRDLVKAGALIAAAIDSIIEYERTVQNDIEGMFNNE